MSQHIATRFLALTTFGGTFHHHLIALHHLTKVAALFAYLQTRVADLSRVGTLPSHDTSRRGTNRRTILTRLHRLQMVLFSFGEQFRAVGCTRITGQGTFPALARAGHSRRGVIVVPNWLLLLLVTKTYTEDRYKHCR
jgi:hypothetical protein